MRGQIVNNKIERVEIIGAENQEDQSGSLKLHLFWLGGVDEIVDVPWFPKRDDLWRLFTHAKAHMPMTLGGPICKTALDVFELREDAWDTGFAIQGIDGFIFQYEYQPEKVVKDGSAPDIPAHFELCLHGHDPKHGLDEGLILALLGNAASTSAELDRSLSYTEARAKQEHDEASKVIDGLRRDVSIANDRIASLSLRLNQEMASAAVSAKKIDVLDWTTKQYAEKSNWDVNTFKGSTPGTALAQEALNHPIFGGR